MIFQFEVICGFSKKRGFTLNHCVEPLEHVRTCSILYTVVVRIVGKEIPISDVFGALFSKAKRVEFRINKLIRQSSFDQGLRPDFEIQYIFWAKRFICGFSKNDFFRHF